MSGDETIAIVVEVPADYSIRQQLDVEEAVREAVFDRLRGDITVGSRPRAARPTTEEREDG